MSKYSFSADFRDLLSDYFNDSWEYFQHCSGGLISTVDSNGQIKLVHITKPAELIPYYPHKVIDYNPADNYVYILLSSESAADVTIDNMEDLNSKYGVSDTFEPFNTDELREAKQELLRLYKEAISSDIKEII